MSLSDWCTFTKLLVLPRLQKYFLWVSDMPDESGASDNSVLLTIRTTPFFLSFLRAAMWLCAFNSLLSASKSHFFLVNLLFHRI